MMRARTATLLGFLVLGACSAERPINPPFQREYRDRYGITTEELKKLQFYISREVLAHAMDGVPGVQPEQVVIVASRTPGLVRDAGPDWLRVAFREGGEGVLFRLRNDRAGAVYALATQAENGKIVLVSELPEPILTQGGRRYKLAYGADAYLIVDAVDLSTLIQSRPHAGGVVKPKE